MPAKAKEISAKDQVFINEYLIDFDAERAALKAGFSPSVARTKSFQWVSNCKLKPLVYKAIRDKQKRHSGKLEITQERVLREYARLAFLDIRKAFNAGGDLKPIVDLDDDTAAAVAGLEFEEVFEGRGDQREHVGRIHKIKLANKLGALDSLAKHLGLFKEAEAPDISDGLKELAAAIRDSPHE